MEAHQFTSGTRGQAAFEPNDYFNNPVSEQAHPDINDQPQIEFERSVPGCDRKCWLESKEIEQISNHNGHQ